MYLLLGGELTSSRYQAFIWSGFLVATVAFACFTLLTSVRHIRNFAMSSISNFLQDTSTAMTSVLLVIAGLGVGPNFNSPLFPIHASFDMRDDHYATLLSQSTSAYAFLRSLGSSIGISASGLVFFEDVVQHQLPTLSVFNLTQAIENSDLLTQVEEQANVEVLHAAMQHVFIQVCICMGAGLFLSLLIGRHKFSNEPKEDPESEPRAVPRVDSFGTEDG